MFKQLEKKIKDLFIQIKSQKITPKDSGIGKWLNSMKEIDEPAYDKLMDEYKTILAGLKG